MRKTFVIQRESARSGPFILELEAGARKRAWSVARGPSLDPTRRRVAHALDGNARRTSAPVWDHGTWKSPARGVDALDADYLEFSLAGAKLQGTWSLERTASRWQLVKHDDEYAVPGADVVDIDRAYAMVLADQERRKPALAFVPLALATLAEAPPEGAGWIHEVKLDGYRIEALIEGSSVRLLSRNAKDWTDRFPAVVRALQALDVRSAILDGEIVSMDERGISSFQQLQQSGQAVGRQSDPPLRYYVFDVLSLDGRALTGEPLERRLPMLAALLGRVKRSAVVQPVGRFEPAAGDVLEQACRAGEEGVISKRLDARYTGGRGRAWIKSKCGRRQEFVIVGYTEPQGSRTGFGSLLLAVNDEQGLRYTGRVGTGFDASSLDALYARLRKLETATSPLAARPAGVVMRTVHWVKPSLVAEVAFTEWTNDGLLRHPSFKGLREDKPARDVWRERA